MAESYSFGYWGSTSEEILKSQFPLHRACRDGDVEELSRLLVVAQNGIYEEDSFYGWTPAHWAAYFGKLACLRKLMTVTRIGVNCNIRTSRFKHTPAHLAAFQGHPQCLLWLLQYGAEMDAQDYLGETCVHKAARTGSMECVSLLTSHGARLYIHNNNGKLASEVAAMCGFEECARYLNVATKRQEDQARGVYQAGPDAHAAKTPSPLDITINGKVEPCVIMQGLNGGRLPPPGPGGENMDCEMETESQGTFINGSSLPENVSLPCKTDVTLSSKNVVVAGRKRGREDAEDMDYKRMRRSEGSGIEFNGFSFENSPTVEPMAESCQITSGVNGHNSTLTQSTKDTKKITSFIDDDNDYSVGYDYCGIPQYLDEAEPYNSMQQNSFKCSIGGLNGHMI